jgi:Divergent InlB B-repeat domain
MAGARGIAAAATRMRRLARASATLFVLAFALLVVAGAQGGADQAQIEVKLQVLAGPHDSGNPPSGDDVFVTPADLDGKDSCTDGFVGCTFRYLAPTTVRLIAQTINPTYHFYGWTAVECADDVNACDLGLTGDEPVVSAFALYDPARILLGVAGPGTVRWLEGGLVKECVSQAGLQTTCSTEDLPARDPIEFEADSSSPIEWAAGCEPVPNDARRCVARPENRALMVGFDGEAPPRPFNVDVTLRVGKTGSGDGKITGFGFDCGSGADCRKLLDFGKIVSLQAEAAAGSRFDRWVGVCASAPTCRFSAGPVTSVQARFVEEPAPPPPPSPPPPPPATKLDVRVTKLTAFRRAGRWRVTARIVANKRVLARARVGRGRRTWANRTVNLRAGRSLLTVQLARRATRGRCWFQLVAWTAGGEVRTLPRRTVKLGR